MSIKGERLAEFHRNSLTFIAFQNVFIYRFLFDFVCLSARFHFEGKIFQILLSSPTNVHNRVFTAYNDQAKREVNSNGRKIFYINFACLNQPRQTQPSGILSTIASIILK